MKRAPASRHRRGFTLIEALAAVVFVAIVLPVVMQGFSVATAAGEVAKRRAEAATLAHSVLSELAVTKEWQTGNLAGDFGVDHPSYTWKADLQSWDSSTLIQLNVRVIWVSGGREEEVVMSTLVEQGAN